MYTALEDIKLETIDFDWIAKTTKVSHIKRAIRLIELDGDYFTELKHACYNRLQELDPKERRIEQHPLTETEKKLIDDELLGWEENVGKKTMKAPIVPNNLEDVETYFDNTAPKTGSEAADRQRIKGNEALRSKDLDEAIQFYTRSLQLDPRMYQSFANRGLVHLKRKEFAKCLNDCQKALSINPKYVKAQQRKAKALVGLSNSQVQVDRKVEAYREIQQAIMNEPTNDELVKQLKGLREEMNAQQLEELERGTTNAFRKIAIEEASDEQDD